jgi:septum formation protein
MENQLILASSSPRRFELLNQLGIDFLVVPSLVEEDFVEMVSPEDYVIRLAEAKAIDVGNRYPNHWVIGADTIVYIDGLILGKPKGDRDAMDMLSRLSGREHQVLSGIFVSNLNKRKSEAMTVRTGVKIKTLTPSEMEWYIRTGEPFDKAGGYAIQGIGSFMIEWINGSFTNVIGLPLCELIQMLISLDAIRFPPPHNFPKGRWKD